MKQRTIATALWMGMVVLVSVGIGWCEVSPSAQSDSEAPVEDNGIVAVVNNEVITKAEFHRALAPVYLQFQASLSPEELSKKMDEIRQEVIQQLVDERLMLQAARNPKPVEVAKGKVGTPPPIQVSDREVEEALERVRRRFADEEGFAKALKEQGLTEADLRERFRQQIVIQKLIAREVHSRVSVSPSEIAAYYQAHRDRFKVPMAIQVATIFIRPRDDRNMAQAGQLAHELYQRLRQGADFYELARRYSDGFNAQMGGRIGFLEKGKNRKEIEEILFQLKAGELSPVIQTPAGFHIFLIEAVRPERQMEWEEVQEEIRSILFEEKSALRYKTWIARLREEAYVSIQLP
jgi:parvulin-like peptidyl-prolyl isomerase